MLLNELRDYNASLLQTALFKDYCPNGLQVEGRAEVRRIATGVTASQQVLDAAIAWGADTILVHHGYFWRSEDAVITGIKKRRIAELLRNDVSLLAYHLPLDAHPELGNNARLGKLLGLAEVPSPVTLRAIQSKAASKRASSQPRLTRAQHRFPCKQSAVPEGAPLVVNWPVSMRACSIRY